MNAVFVISLFLSSLYKLSRKKEQENKNVRLFLFGYAFLLLKYSVIRRPLSL